MVDFIDRRRPPEVPPDEPFIFDRFIHREIEDREYKKINSENNILSLKKLWINENFIKENKEEYFPLRNINPVLLEREDTDRRVDDFIGDVLRQRPADYLILREPVLPLPVLTETVRTPGHVFQSSTGLRVITWDRGYGSDSTDFRVGGRVVVSGTDKFTEIHFTPEGRARFNPKKMTDSLANGIKGLVELLEAIDKGKVNVADYLVGTTNINMALIAQRLGFVITDDCRTADGAINRDLGLFKIVGKLADIRAKVEEFQRSGASEKLMRRSQKLRTNPQPA
jgi:hypothetical protein